MKGRPTIDMSDAPIASFGAREPLWWGVVFLIVIEAVAFGLLLATYFYVRGNFEVWPPTDPGDRARWLGAAGCVVLVLGSVAMVFVNRAARRLDLRGTRRPLILATLLSIVFVVLRAYELEALHFDWDDHAYGSVVWMTLGMHTLHGLTGVLENVVFVVLFFRGPVEKKHYLDADLDSLYWHFIVAWGLVLFAIFYFEGVLFPR